MSVNYKFQKSSQAVCLWIAIPLKAGIAQSV